jgi:hypothetical protein
VVVTINIDSLANKTQNDKILLIKTGNDLKCCLNGYLYIILLHLPILISFKSTETADF